MYGIANAMEQGKLEAANALSDRAGKSRGTLSASLYIWSARDQLTRVGYRLPVALRVADWDAVLTMLGEAKFEGEKTRTLRILTADEILSMAESGDAVILRGWGATSLLKEVPHAVRVCVSASRRTRVRRMMERLKSDDARQVERIVDHNDEAARAVMRRHFHVDPRDINEYDMGFNTDRVAVEQCVDEIVKMVKSRQFAETQTSRAKLRDIALAHHVRAALRTHGSTSHCPVRVVADDGRVELRGDVDNIDQSEACSDIALRIKGVRHLENHLNVIEVTGRKSGEA